MSVGAVGLTRDDIESWARELYAEGVDHKDAAAFAAVFAPDASLQFGNSPPIVGREAIQDAIAQFFTAFVALRHTSVGTWIDGDTVVLEAVVTYTRHDGGVVSVPATTIFILAPLASSDEARPIVKLCRIYVDLMPLFAPAA
jgi:uncharacterized protein (TIGR02246 family)